MQIILVNNHGNKLVDEYKTDDHARYGNHHVIGQAAHHAENAAVPALRRLPNNSRINNVIKLLK